MQSFSFLFRKSKLFMLRKFSAHVLYVRHLFYLHPDDWPNQRSLHDIILMPWCNEDGKEGITWLKAVCCRVWYISNFAVSLPRSQDSDVSSTSTTCYAMDLWYPKWASLLVSPAKQLLQRGAGLSWEKKQIHCLSEPKVGCSYVIFMHGCMHATMDLCLNCPTEDCRGVFNQREKGIWEDDGTRVVSNFLYERLYFLDWALYFYVWDQNRPMYNFFVLGWPICRRRIAPLFRLYPLIPLVSGGVSDTDPRRGT
jgi:hypothetical protein